MLSVARRALPVVIAALLVFAGATTASAGPRTADRHRVVAYYQTQYVTGADGNQQYVSPLPLRGIATDIDVAALHLNSDGSVHLNDDPPSAAKFRQMWADLALLRHSGTRVEAMLGGAGVGSFANLHADFPKYYGLLRQTLRTYHFDGVDLDIEEPFSLADTEHLIRQLRHDFGPHFVIAMAPVASDLSGQSTFSGGFDYSTLEHQVGRDVDWYNAQFYCGWGDLASTTDYDAVVAHGFGPSRVVAGTVTNPANCGGYIDPATLSTTISALAAKYHSFAGVAGWEYFNSLGSDGPQSWYAAAKSAMLTRPA
ncbi:MAG TPA: glycosyl hydrolase family 18 protein [Mycobacteriales bacterium]|jgi:chitinase|nr:glycosyl hydrolase family 18 protein [Mycobacteriales bacterium]